MKAAVAGTGTRFGGRFLDPPEQLADGFDPMLAVGQRLQLAVGGITLLALWALPPFQVRQQLVVTAVVLGVYLPWSIASRRWALLRRGAGARLLHLAFDLGAVGTFALVLPSTRTAAMLAYSLVVVFHTKISGLRAGASAAAGAVGLAGLAEWAAPAGQRMGAFTMVMFTVVLLALAYLVDALAAERRRAVRHLSRLHRAVEHLASEPTLSATTAAIARAAREAVGASVVLVLLPRDDQTSALDVAGGAGFNDELRDLLHKALRNPTRSASITAMTDGRVLTVPDLAADERFAWAAPTLARYEARAVVAVPLGPPSQPIGVLNAYFDELGGFDDDDVHLLQAYGRQASVAVARALAFEQHQRAAVQLAEADRLKSDFVSTISHELRTPLTSISGFIDTVLLRWDQLGDHDKRELLHRSAWNAGELRRLIEQVLTFSALEGGELLAERRPYALRTGVEELVDHMGPALRGCRVDVDIEDDLVVLASRDAVHHVIGNLVTNASKFSPAGSTIRIVGRRASGVARIEVTDEGPGVPESERDRIFERFYRGSTTRSTRGTGIGLAIVKTSVEALGGTVDLRDAVHGEGATFVVTLPLADSAAEATVILI